jgi:MFS family permease
MAAGAILVIIATLMQTFAPRGQIGTFIAGRVVIGIGQGLALTAGSIYIGELSPPEIRGKIMSFWQMFYSVGSFIAYWVSFATSKHPKGLGDWDWKMVVIFQLLVPILILSQVFFIPEVSDIFLRTHVRDVLTPYSLLAGMSRSPATTKRPAHRSAASATRMRMSKKRSPLYAKPSSSKPKPSHLATLLSGRTSLSGSACTLR